MRQMMITAGVTAFASLAFIPASFAETITYNGFSSGDIHDINLRLTETGNYTFRVTSGTGDIDIAVFNADGNRVGYGNLIGNDILQGNLQAGQYTIRLRMAVCLNPIGTCDASFEAFIDEDPLNFSSEQQEESQVGGNGLGIGFETCVAFVLSQNPEYNLTTAELLCR